MVEPFHYRTSALISTIALFSVVYADFRKCFISHKNIRISCGKPFEIRASVSLDECQQLCIRQSSRCQSLQYDFYRDSCEIFDVASPLRVNLNATSPTVLLRKRSADAKERNNPECTLATLAPTIGTSHLIPVWDCVGALGLNQSDVATPSNHPKPEVRIQKLSPEKDTVVSNTRGSSGDEHPNRNANSHPSLERSQAAPRSDTNPDPRASSDYNGPRGGSPAAEAPHPGSGQPHQFQGLAVEVLPLVPDCPMGEHARVQIIDGVQVDATAAIAFKATVVEQCVQALRTSTFPDGSRLPLLCRSAQFDRSEGKCSVFPDSINPNGYLDYKPNTQVLYMEKICIPDIVLPLSCDDVFRRIPQHIILGHASEILSVASEQECVLECIRAKSSRGMECHSVLHYPDFATFNCILNVHTRHTRNNYFMPELMFKVDYVELATCASQVSYPAGHVPTTRIGHAPLDPFEKTIPVVGVGSVISDWSEWTTCSEETSTRSRQRHCNGCKEIIQFLPCFSNNNFDLALQKFINEQKHESPVNEVQPEKAAPLIPFPGKTEPESAKQPRNAVEFFGPPLNQLSESHAFSY